MASQFRGHSPATAESRPLRARRESYPNLGPDSTPKRERAIPYREKSPLAGPEALWLSDATAAQGDDWTDSGDDYRYTLAAEGGRA